MTTRSYSAWALAASVVDIALIPHLFNPLGGAGRGYLQGATRVFGGLLAVNLDAGAGALQHKDPVRIINVDRDLQYYGRVSFIWSTAVAPTSGEGTVTEISRLG